MKITGTNSYIRVEVGGKTVKISGEMTSSGFIAYKDSICNWEMPYDNERISDAQKQEIITKVIAKTKGSHMPILFE